MISEATTRRGTHRTLPRFAAPRVAWQRIGLGLTLLIATLFNCWQISTLGYANTYYAAAVRSMLQSWHNFFFVSFDPGGFVSVDKPPLGFWIQTASAKLFGFHGWSILLPEAIAGVCSVAVLYHLVRRVFGETAGLIAALALAVTPISVVTNRNNTIDSLLVLTVLLATWAMVKATETGRLRWLLASMTLVGLGFNIKMLEAYLVLPALVLVYLFGVKHGWGKRIAHLAVAMALLLAVSLAWVVAVDLTPASARPYVGSTQDNSELSLALGYNGLNRLLGNTNMRPGAAAGQAPNSAQFATDNQIPAPPPLLDGQQARPGGPNGGGFPGGGPAGGGPGGVGENGAQGVFRLLDLQLGGQIGWLLPLALIGLVGAGGWLFLRRSAEGSTGAPHATQRARAALVRFLRESLDSRQQAVVLWGIWTLTMAAFFSVAGMFHRYYLSMLAPGIAALVGIGIAALWQAYHRRHPVGWLLPVAILGTAAVQAKILADYPAYARWLTPPILGASLVAVVGLVLARVRPVVLARRRLGIGAAALGLCALLIAPTVWAAVSVRGGGGGGLPAAGPQQQGFGFPGGMPSDMGAQQNSPLIAYLEANRGTATYLAAVPSSQSADSIIIATGEPVMAMGGFTGSDPILTARSFAQLVQDSTVRYVLLGGGGPGGVPSGQSGQASATQWVMTSCSAVASSAYQSSTTTSSAGRFGNSQQLYDCGSAATKG